MTSERRKQATYDIDDFLAWMNIKKHCSLRKANGNYWKGLPFSRSDYIRDYLSYRGYRSVDSKPDCDKPL